MKTTTFKFNDYTAFVVNINQYPSIEFCRKFFPQFKKFSDFFGEDKVFEVIKNRQIKICDFMVIKYYSYNDTFNLIRNGYYLADNNIHAYKKIEYKGTWSREVDERGYAVLVKNQYDYRFISIIFKALLLSEFPYLKKFEYELYVYEPTLNSDIDEEWIFLYVNMNKSIQKISPIYIKCKRLKERNFIGIIQDHINYYTNYYKWSGGWRESVTENDVLKWRKESCSAVYTSKAQEFFEAVERDKLEHSDTSWMDSI